MFGDKKHCKKCGAEIKKGDTVIEVGSFGGGFLCVGCNTVGVQLPKQDNSWQKEYFESLKSKNYPPLRIKPIKTEDGKKAWQIVDTILPENVVLGLDLDSFQFETTLYYRVVDKNTFSLCKHRGY